MNDYSEELSFAKELALKAGEIMVSHFLTSSASTKGNFTPVTEADVAISKLVSAEISKHFPKHHLLDEELNTETQKDGYVWVCDPLDGTIPYSNRIPTSVFSLALCKDGDPVVAVVNDPYIKRLFYTVKGGKSYLNEKEIQVNTKKLQKGEAVYTVPHWLSTMIDFNKLYEYFHKKNVLVTTVESMVYILVLIASGAINGAVLFAAYPWDRAAGKLILENAGGIFTDETKAPLTVFGKHKVCIASNKESYKELLDVVTLCLKK